MLKSCFIYLLLRWHYMFSTHPIPTLGYIIPPSHAHPFIPQLPNQPIAPSYVGLDYH